jgi:hypothetical protein
MKFDRFDFEQAIMQCWGVTKDISTLFNRFAMVPIFQRMKFKIIFLD